jgi:hypothetical protein
MKSLVKRSASILFGLLILLASCNDDDDAQRVEKSSDNAIASFKFLTAKGEAVGTIETDNRIIITVPNGTPLNSLVPIIEIPEKAMITPGSGVAQDFTLPVDYLVRAENGSVMRYTVVVLADTIVDFTIDPDININLYQDGFLVINGTGFGDYSKNKVELRYTGTGEVIEVKPTANSTDTHLEFKLAPDIVVGGYKVRLFIGLQNKLFDEVFLIYYHPPVIYDVSKTTAPRGETFVISGKYFNASSLIVSLFIPGSFEYQCTIISVTETSIEVKVPKFTSLGMYNLKILRFSYTSIFSNKIEVVRGTTEAFIQSASKTDYQRGETIILYGVNFKKEGSVTNINFMPAVTNGVTLVRSGSASANGTEISFVIPNDFPTASYAIRIEIDGEYSDIFGLLDIR